MTDADKEAREELIVPKPQGLVPGDLILLPDGTTRVYREASE